MWRKKEYEESLKKWRRELPFRAFNVSKIKAIFVCPPFNGKKINVKNR